MILAWGFSFTRNGAAAARITSDGTLVPGWPSQPDVGVDTSNSGHSGVGIAPDGAGGAIIVWEDDRNGAWNQLYAQHLVGSGATATGWPAGGLRVCSFPTAASVSRPAFLSPTYSSIATDGSGGAFVTWSDARADTGDIYIQHLRPDVGIAPGWPDQGLALCVAPGPQLRPTIIADGMGGAFVAWEDARSGAANVFIQHVSSSAAIAPGWPAGGLAVHVESSEQLHPRLASDGSLGVIVAWEDHRDVASQIYAARITSDGKFAGVEPTATGEPLSDLVRLTPNPSRGVMNASFTLESGAPARIDVVDIAGRRVESIDLGALGAGRHSVRLGSGRRYPPGVYLLRLTQGARVVAARGCVLE